MGAVAESGRNPVSKIQIQMNRLARDGAAKDVPRGGRTCLAIPNFQALTGTGKTIFPVQLTTSRTGNLTRLNQTLLQVSLSDNHTYIFLSSKPRTGLVTAYITGYSETFCTAHALFIPIVGVGNERQRGAN